MGRIKRALAEYNDPKYFSWFVDKLDLISKYGLDDIIPGKFLFWRKSGIKWHYTFNKICRKCGEICGINPHPRYCECGGDWKTVWRKEQLWTLEDGPLGLMMIFSYLYENGGVLGGLR